MYRMYSWRHGRLCTHLLTKIPEKRSISASHKLWLELYYASFLKKYIWYFSAMQITFVDNKKLQSALLEEIDVDQLPQIYGGKLELIPIHDA